MERDDRVNDISKMKDRIRRTIVIIGNNNDKRNEEDGNMGNILLLYGGYKRKF